jgi:hypothetical protein
MVSATSCSRIEDRNILTLNSELGGSWSVIEPVESCFSLMVVNSDRLIENQDSMDYYAAFAVQQFSSIDTVGSCLVINVVQQTGNRTSETYWIWQLPITNVSSSDLK